jgi:hypothetical protein
MELLWRRYLSRCNSGALYLYLRLQLLIGVLAQMQVDAVVKKRTVKGSSTDMSLLDLGYNHVGE